MKYFCMFVLSTALFGNVDIVMGDLNQDELVISWAIGDSCFVSKYYGGLFHEQVVLSGHSFGTLGLACDPSDGKHVLYAVTEQAQTSSDYIHVYVYEDLNWENQEFIDPVSDGDVVSLGFLKSPSEEWDAVLGGGALWITSIWTYVHAVQIAYNINEAGALEIADYAQAIIQFYKDVDHTEASYPGLLVGVIECPGGYPLMATSFGVYGNYYKSHAFCFDPDSSELLYSELGNELCTPEYSGVIALGSSSDTETVLLFSNETGDVNWYEFLPSSPNPSDSLPYPWVYPRHNDPVAMTSTYDLPGILMVWYANGEIRCRHWEGGWNDFDHIASYTGGAVSEEDIAVVCDTDGYWITWLEGGSSEPVVVFIPFDDVTGISGETESTGGVFIRPFRNPSCGSMSFEITGVQTGTVSVFDISGRLVVRNEVQGEGIHTIDVTFSPGMYLVRLHCDTGDISCKVIVN